MASLRQPLACRSLLSVLHLLMRLSLYYGTFNIGAVATETPHILIILADDLGFDDVSLHGNDQIPTPNIDALGYQGQILNRHYVAPMCTPSRSVLMTGKYMLRVGMQHSVIANPQPWGLPVEERVMPQYLQQLGYETNLVGKWHLGMAWSDMTPTARGFDHFRGYLGAYVDYYQHHYNGSGMSGHDWRRNKEVDMESRGKYATDLITEHAIEVIERHNASKPLFLLVSHMAPHAGNNADPMQAPEEYVNRFLHIKDINRRIYAAMLTKLDESVGQIVDSLKRQNVLKDSIILFMADNGAPSLGEHANSGSNYPLRGQKNSPWEGAVRSAACIWSADLETRHINNDNLIYIGDWLPTLLNRAKTQQMVPQDIDGVDQWDVLSRPAETPSARKEILHNIDPVGDDGGYASYLRGDGFKYIFGTTSQNKFGGWLGSDRSWWMDIEEYVNQVQSSKVWSALEEYALRNLTQKDIVALRSVEICKSNGQPSVPCDPIKSPCLFNVFEDPCERNNLADVQPEILQELQAAVNHWKSKAVPINNKPSDPLSNPIYHGNVWTSWRDVGEV